MYQKKKKSTQITSLQPTWSPQVPNCQSPSRQKISSSWKKNYKYTLGNESISQGKIIFNHTLGENMLVPSKNRPLFSAKPIKNCQPKKKTRKGTEASIIFPTKLAPFYPFPSDSTFKTHWKTPQTDEPRQGMDRGIQILGTFVVKVPKDVQRRLFFRSGGTRRPISFSVLEPRFGRFSEAGVFYLPIFASC